MRQTTENPSSFQPTPANYVTNYVPDRFQGAVRDPITNPTERNLNDYEAVVAVMVANGLTCESVALRLSLPLSAIEEHLQNALNVLGLSAQEDLNYLIVAARYGPDASRAHFSLSRPTVHDQHSVESADEKSQLTAPASRGDMQASHSSEPELLIRAATGSHLNSLVLLDTAQETREHDKEPLL